MLPRPKASNLADSSAAGYKSSGGRAAGHLREVRPPSSEAPTGPRPHPERGAPAGLVRRGRPAPAQRARPHDDSRVPQDRLSRGALDADARRDLATLYAMGYRLIALGDLLDGRIVLPADTTPIVLTFDDSSPGQFRYIEQNGVLTIDPKPAVGILDAFAREHPDFGRATTFFVLPAADLPNRLFNQPAWQGHKLRYLVSHGYEIGNHTLWHANLAKYPEATVRIQLAEAQAWIQRHVPDYRIRALALPYGAYPSDVSWLLRGSAKGTTYRHDAMLKVGGGAAPSPFSRAFDPVRLPRIQAIERELAHWLGYFERNPGERFVSDGDPDAVTVPAALHDRLRGELPRRLRIVDR